MVPMVFQSTSSSHYRDATNPNENEEIRKGLHLWRLCDVDGDPAIWREFLGGESDHRG